MKISFITSANNQIPRIKKKSIELMSKHYGEKIKIDENFSDLEYYSFPTSEGVIKS